MKKMKKVRKKEEKKSKKKKETTMKIVKNDVVLSGFGHLKLPVVLGRMSSTNWIVMLMIFDLNWLNGPHWVIFKKCIILLTKLKSLGLN